MDDIAADLHVFHGVEEPMQLPSSRYLMWAERLVYRDGAVRGALLAEMQQSTPTPAPSAAVAPAQEVQRVDDPRALEALTNQNGFSGFEYVGGD